ncbi:MAG: hypothetical protein QE278_13100 [Limnobacter sp.]|nr:hypothetical protein [Limnobacter sp.]
MIKKSVLSVLLTTSTAFFAPHAQANGPIGFALDIARDSVDTGLSIAKESVRAGTQIASDVVHALTPEDRRQLRGYCRKNMGPYSERSRRRLPNDWEEEVYVSGPAPSFVYRAGAKVPRSAPGMRNQPRTTVAFRIEQSVILIDSRDGVVVDIVGL